MNIISPTSEFSRIFSQCINIYYIEKRILKNLSVTCYFCNMKFILQR